MIFRINLLSPILVLLVLAILPISPVSAQRQKKADKQILANLDMHIRYLSGEKGSKTGSPGEKQAGDYIASEFSKAGLQPRGDNGGWLQRFDNDEGRVVSGDAYFIINDHPLVLNKEYFPLAFSAIGTVSGSPAIALQESGVPWFLDLRDLLENQDGVGVRSDLTATLRAKAAAFAKKGATALIVYNSSKTADNLVFDPKDKSEPAAIPIVYITSPAKRKYLRDESASVDIRLKTGFAEKKITGHNVVGYIDNGAASTVVIGARYDCPGKSGDSVADVRGEDNSAGVASMIELARMLASSKLKSNNYLFVAFSGGDRGSFGSKFMAEHPQQMNYMLDLARLVASQDSSYGLIIGGSGSSPAWWGTCREAGKTTLTIHLDSSYAKPGDQAFFNSKGVPALVFYMGADRPDHELELAVVKYVFDVVKAANTRGKLKFTATGT